MTALQQANPTDSAPIDPAADTRPFSVLFKEKDTYAIAEVYYRFCDMLGGDIRVTRADKRGFPDWARVRSGEYDKPSRDSAPDTFDEVERRFVLVDYVEGCRDDSVFAVYFDPSMGYGDLPKVVKIKGSAVDGAIGKMVIYRTLGLESALQPQIMFAPQIAVTAANDNEPVEPRDLPDLPSMAASAMTPDAAGGLLADVARWITSTAIVPVPELSMASAVALIGGMFGDCALGPTQSGVNVYLTTLLDTAGGKGHPPKAIRAIAAKAGRSGAVTNGDPTSYAAIERILRKNSSTVVVFDEFGVTLQDVNGRNSTAASASIRKFLLAIYDQANSLFDGRIYASSDAKKDDSSIDGPALTILGMTTPETLYAGLSAQSIADGFINRFLFVTGTAPTSIRPPKLHRNNEPPEELLESLRQAILGFPRMPGNVRKPKTVIEFDGGETGAAYGRWSEVFTWQHSQAWDETERHINGRAAENTVRLATIRAISRDPAAPLVTVADVEWGWAIVHASIELVTAGAEKHMSASPAEALRKAIVAALRDAADHTMPLSKLMVRRGVSGADIRELQSALRWLSDSGEVTDLAGRQVPGRGSKFRWNGVGTAVGTLERQS